MKNLKDSVHYFYFLLKTHPSGTIKWSNATLLNFGLEHILYMDRLGIQRGTATKDPSFLHKQKKK